MFFKFIIDECVRERFAHEFASPFLTTLAVHTFTVDSPRMYVSQQVRQDLNWQCIHSIGIRAVLLNVSQHISHVSFDFLLVFVLVLILVLPFTSCSISVLDSVDMFNIY
jgi:hypothetical protein